MAENDQPRVVRLPHQSLAAAPFDEREFQCGETPGRLSAKFGTVLPTRRAFVPSMPIFEVDRDNWKYGSCGAQYF